MQKIQQNSKLTNKKLFNYIGFLTKLPIYLIIYFYRYIISPIIGPRCRFLPTCSDYALEVIQSKGLAKGSLMSFKRICKCHPFGGSGYDPVPKE
ncbi:MAG: membrane protein insertion efficiency factor YidD [Rickettsiales bacterium]|nr:membrane protein insertion efficiency factor YidD [Rickettsiales bacterium]